MNLIQISVNEKLAKEYLSYYIRCSGRAYSSEIRYMRFEPRHKKFVCQEKALNEGVHINIYNYYEWYHFNNSRQRTFP